MSAHETIIAIDFGLRNIGVAVGNTLSLTSRPLTILQARDGVPDWDALSSIFSEWRPDRILVGNPLNMDDSERSWSPSRGLLVVWRGVSVDRDTGGRASSSREAGQRARSGHCGDLPMPRLMTKRRLSS